MIYDGATNEWKLKEQICEIGRRVYQRGFAAANDGNISVRVGPNRVLCSPTMICKGFMKPDDICTVDLDGNQLAGRRKRTSEILLHLAVMKARDDVVSCVHCHPPHATAFAVAHEAIPKCVLPEVEVFLGEVPIAQYETPGTQRFAETVLPFVHGTNTIILANHGTISFGKDVEDAYWKSEILDAYCRILMLAKQLGPINYFDDQQTRELLEFKKRLGIADPRLECEECDLCGNSLFRNGYRDWEPQSRAFPTRDEGKCTEGRCDCGGSCDANRGETNPSADVEALVQAITDQVMASLPPR
jgi:L-fuculose-phosphate aldolase